MGEMNALEVYAGIASEAERARLRLTAEEHVYRIARLRSHMGNAFLTETVSLPMAMFPGLVERGLASSGLTTIANAYGLLLGQAVEMVLPGAASTSTSSALKIAEGSPVLVLDRIIYTRAGRPAQWRVGECCMTSDLHYKVETT